MIKPNPITRPINFEVIITIDKAKVEIEILGSKS